MENNQENKGKMTFKKLLQEGFDGGLFPVLICALFFFYACHEHDNILSKVMLSQSSIIKESLNSQHQDLLVCEERVAIEPVKFVENMRNNAEMLGGGAKVNSESLWIEKAPGASTSSFFGKSNFSVYEVKVFCENSAPKIKIVSKDSAACKKASEVDQSIQCVEAAT